MAFIKHSLRRLTDYRSGGTARLDLAAIDSNPILAHRRECGFVCAPAHKHNVCAHAPHEVLPDQHRRCGSGSSVKQVAIAFMHLVHEHHTSPKVAGYRVEGLQNAHDTTDPDARRSKHTGETVHEN